MSGVPAHVPVMLAEVLDALAPRPGARFLDATFGCGGYSRALLDASPCRVLAIDRDPAAHGPAAELGRDHPGAFTFRLGPFSRMESFADEEDHAPIDGIAFDVGVSSIQLDTPSRGFSFSAPGPLDMRMGGDGPTAADLVAELDEGALADVIRRYGEERRARRIARAIVGERADRPIRTTDHLAGIVASVVPSDGRIHPATRTFQALRIAVNDELDELDRGLAAAERLLAPGGRLAVVSFHSLEDRIVKRFLAARSPGGGSPRHRPEPPRRAATFRPLHRGAQRPGPAETAANPRARSARLRTAERLTAP